MAKPLDLNFTTLLKLWALKQPAMRRELAKFLSPGGYDFYRSLKRVGAAVCLDKVDRDTARAELQQIRRSVEREHNSSGFKKLEHWLDKQQRTYVVPPKGKHEFEGGSLAIHVRPEISFVQDENHWALHLWNTQSPELTDDIYGLGAFLMQRAINIPSLRVGILNLRNGHVYDYRLARNFNQEHLDARLRQILTAWNELQ